MNIKEAIDYAYELIYQGKEYDEIRTTLSKLNLDTQSIQTIMKTIDDDIAHYQLATEQKNNLLLMLIVGATVCILGIIFTAFLYVSSMESYFWGLGLILFGLWIFSKNYPKYKRPIQDFMPPKKRI